MVVNKFSMGRFFVFVVLFIFIGIMLLSSGVLSGEKTIGKLGPLLTKLVREYQQEGLHSAIASARGHQLRTQEIAGKTLIPVILEPLDTEKASSIDAIRIAGLGGKVDAISESYMRILIGVSDLKSLAYLPDVKVVRSPLVAKPLSTGFGPLVSESVDLTGADTLQNAGITGNGVKVAVVDLGFTNIDDAVANGELPGDYTAVKGNVEGVNIDGWTVHGTGVAEHVMDMAPGAVLYCILVEDEVDLENAADYCASNGIRVANHSVGWVNASYYDDTGPITSIVNESSDVDGVFWAVSAGNDAEVHWRGDWYDPDANDTLNYTAGDDEMELSGTYSTVSVFLNWDQYGNSLTDLDFYVVDKNGSVVASSEAPQSGPEDPAEYISFDYSGTEAPYSLKVYRYSGPTEELDITIFSFYHGLEYPVAASSIMEPSDAHGSFSVGAIYHGDYDLPDPPLEDYSSHGPTTDGRSKPNIAAPDGTTSYTYPSAYGTSFSSPTTAGAALLLLEIYSSLTPQELADSLSNMAIDAGPPGPDYGYGAGKLNFSISIDSLPDITGIIDVPDDEGLEVDITFDRSFYDFGGSPREIDYYSIYRLSESMTWDSVMAVTADGSSQYAVTAPTEKDSTVTGGMYLTTFKVRAVRAASGEYYESLPGEGYSVDNLTPAIPTNLTVGYNSPGGNLIFWDQSPAPDIDHFNIYRDLSGTFIPGPGNLVHTVSDTFWTDPVEDGYLYYYKVSAEDDAGNESEAASPEHITESENEIPKIVALYQNVPNPFNPSTKILFDIPGRMRVRLAIYTVDGRLVRVLHDGMLDGGHREMQWNGRDNGGKRVASGVYLYNITTPGFSLSRKMVLLN